jgi:hypothetical protein
LSNSKLMSSVVDKLSGSSGSGSSNFIAQSVLGALNLGGGKRPRSVTQYDNAEIDKLSSSLLFEVIAATFVHFFNKNNAPLLMLPLMGVSKTLKAPIVLIHLFRMQPVGPLGRPFQSGIEGMLQSLSGPGSATTATTTAATTATTSKEAASTVPFASTATKEGMQQVFDVLQQPIATSEKSVSVSDSKPSIGGDKLDRAKKGKGKRKKKRKSANASGSDATGGDPTASASKGVNVPKTSATPTTSAVVSDKEMSNEILQEVVTGEEEKILPSANNTVEVQQLEEEKDVEVEEKKKKKKKKKKKMLVGKKKEVDSEKPMEMRMVAMLLTKVALKALVAKLKGKSTRFSQRKTL